MFLSTGRQIGIRSQSSDISPDGSYNWQYETENGISASETGSPKAAPEGQSEVNISFYILSSF